MTRLVLGIVGEGRRAVVTARAVLLSGGAVRLKKLKRDRVRDIRSVRCHASQADRILEEL